MKSERPSLTAAALSTVNACAGFPVAATATACDVELALKLRELDVCRLLLKPFKVRGMLEVISALGAPEPLPEH